MGQASFPAAVRAGNLPLHRPFPPTTRSSHKPLAVAAVVAGLAPAPSLSDRWPAFRGPTADGLSDAKNSAAPTWSEKKNVVWKTPIHGKGWASLVVADGKVWVTTADEVLAGTRR